MAIIKNKLDDLSLNVVNMSPVKSAGQPQRPAPEVPPARPPAKDAGDGMTMTTVYLPEGVHLDVKIYCIQNHIKMKNLITEAVIYYMNGLKDGSVQRSPEA